MMYLTCSTDVTMEFVKVGQAMTMEADKKVGVCSH